ncbi:hypothetical protein SGLAM104S_01527 [Streptomyces glaucescens]
MFDGQGHRSGKPHTTPVGYLPDGAERILVIASAGGSPGTRPGTTISSRTPKSPSRTARSSTGRGPNR